MYIILHFETKYKLIFLHAFLDIFENLLTMREWSNENSDESKSSGQSMIDTTIMVSQLVIADYIPTEIATFTTKSMNISTSKITLDIDYNEYCGKGSVEVSEAYMKIKSDNGTQSMDCTFMTTNKNLYFLSIESIDTYINQTNKNDPFQSDYILLDITSEENTASVSTSNNETDNIILDPSDVIVISFDLTNASFFNTFNDYEKNGIFSHFPLCSFYNETILEIDDNNCYLLSYDVDTGVCECGCLHLTYVTTSWEDFEPEVNFLSSSEWNDVTLDNIFGHPLGLIVVLTWILFCVLIIVLIQLNHKHKLKHKKLRYIAWLFDKCERIQDKPLIAESAPNIEKILQNKELKLKYRSIQEIRLIKDDMFENRSFWIKFCHLYQINLRNEHLWLGICFRDYGTHFTHSQRILILMVRLLTTLAVSALFYGKAKNSTVGDISLS